MVIIAKIIMKINEVLNWTRILSLGLIISCISFTTQAQQWTRGDSLILLLLILQGLMILGAMLLAIPARICWMRRSQIQFQYSGARLVLVFQDM
jgi:hypothetical protein